MTIWEQTISKEECQNNDYFLPILESFEYIWTQLIENIITKLTEWRVLVVVMLYCIKTPSVILYLAHI